MCELYKCVQYQMIMLSVSKRPQATQTKWKGLTRILVFIGKQWLALSKDAQQIEYDTTPIHSLA